MTTASTQGSEPAGATRAAFKDWSLACAAVGRGRQSVILRKGGLAEGRGGFEFKHARFWLLPTQYHEQAAKVRPDELAGLGTDADAGVIPADTVEVRYLFELEWSRRVEDWDAVARLAPFHVYREEVARERFAYEDRNHRAGALTVAFGRAFRLETPWRFPDSPALGGCRSWVEIPESPADARLLRVLNDAEHRERALAVELALGGGGGDGDGAAEPSVAALATAMGGMGMDR